MEVTIKMDTSTVKGKVSAIRNIVSMGAIPMDRRLEYVREILGEQAKADSSPPPIDLPSLPRITVRPEALEKRKKELAERELVRDKKEIEAIIYPTGKEYGHVRMEVCTYDKDWNLIETYANIREAAKSLGKGVPTIWNHCNLKTIKMMKVMKPWQGNPNYNVLDYECWVRWKWDHGAPPK